MNSFEWSPGESLIRQSGVLDPEPPKTKPLPLCRRCKRHEVTLYSDLCVDCYRSDLYAEFDTDNFDVGF